jgi:DNA-binding XRE family transcriptional regulator
MHNKIASLRKSWALSQEELGLLLGLSRSSISRMECAATDFSISAAFSLGTLFNTDIAGIFPGHLSKAHDLLTDRLAKFSVLLEGAEGLAADRKRELLSDFTGRFAVADAGI